MSRCAGRARTPAAPQSFPNAASVEKGLRRTRSVRPTSVPPPSSAAGAGKVRLGDVCEEVSVRNRDGEVSSVYSVTNSGGFIPSTEYFSKEVYSKSLTTYKIVEPGMFAYNPSRINVGSVNRWIGDAPVIVSPLYIVVKPDVRNVDGSYLNFFLHSKEALCQIRNLTEGTVRDSLKFSGFQRLTIPLPPLPTQRRIAAELDRLCALKKNAEDRLAILDQLVKSRFMEMFGDPVTNAGGWPTDSLGNRCEITTGNTPPRLNPSNYGDFLEWVKSDNIVDGHLTEARECLSEQGARLSRRAAVGSLLMTCIAGSLNSIGNVALIDREVAFNQQLNAITPKCDDPYFLMWMFKLARPLLRDGINKCLKGILSKGTLSNKRFPFPPLALQREFAAFVASVDKSKAALRETVATLDQLCRAKLQEYFG